MTMTSLKSSGFAGRMRAGRLTGALVLAAELVLIAAIGLMLARGIWLVAFGAGAADVTIDPPAVSASTERTGAPFQRPDGDILFAARNAGPVVEAEAAPETQLDISLHGVRLSSEPATATAILRPGRLTHSSYRVGDEIADGVTLTAIHADRVTIRRNGVSESVFLREDARREPTLIRSEGGRTGNPGLVPAIRNGRLAGFEITAGADPDLLARSGLQTGDLVTAVDGQAITPTTDLPGLAARLRSADTVRLEVERGGRTLTLEAELR
ncbi:type II secretion system protein N [Hyphobacterium marinum]|nr:type II secretion system protein N [Hyphobacterium sp. Y6023]